MMKLQMTVFFLYGIISGAAFTYYLNHEVQKARQEATAAVYLSLPLEKLTEVKI